MHWRHKAAAKGRRRWSYCFYWPAALLCLGTVPAQSSQVAFHHWWIRGAQKTSSSRDERGRREETANIQPFTGNNPVDFKGAFSASVNAVTVLPCLFKAKRVTDSKCLFGRSIKKQLAVNMEALIKVTIKDVKFIFLNGTNLILIQKLSY